MPPVCIPYASSPVLLCVSFLTFYFCCNYCLNVINTYTHAYIKKLTIVYSVLTYVPQWATDVVGTSWRRRGEVLGPGRGHGNLRRFPTSWRRPDDVWGPLLTQVLRRRRATSPRRRQHVGCPQVPNGPGKDSYKKYWRNEDVSTTSATDVLGTSRMDLLRTYWRGARPRRRRYDRYRTSSTTDLLICILEIIPLELGPIPLTLSNIRITVAYWFCFAQRLSNEEVVIEILTYSLTTLSNLD